jgi:hypothetical protein
MKQLLIQVAALFACLNVACASPQEIPKGSKLRAELFDLARPTIEKQAGQPVKFAGSLRQFEGWAFFAGRVVDEKGGTIEFDGVSDTLVIWKETHGSWQLLEASAGVSDMSFHEKWLQEGAPRQLLE